MAQLLKITSSIAPQGSTHAPIVYARVDTVEAVINENDGQVTVKVGANFFKGQIEMIEMSLENVFAEINASNEELAKQAVEELKEITEEGAKIIKLGK